MRRHEIPENARKQRFREMHGYRFCISSAFSVPTQCGKFSVLGQGDTSTGDLDATAWNWRDVTNAFWNTFFAREDCFFRVRGQVSHSLFQWADSTEFSGYAPRQTLFSIASLTLFNVIRTPRKGSLLSAYLVKTILLMKVIYSKLYQFDGGLG